MTLVQRGNTTRFNPRAHERRDNAMPVNEVVAVFQSTRPREARPQSIIAQGIGTSFNPRAHERRDVPVTETSV